MGKVTAYSVCPQDTLHALTNGTVDAASSSSGSSSSSCNYELDHVMKAEASVCGESISSAQAEVGGSPAVGTISGTPPSSLTSEAPLTAISGVAVAVSAPVVVSMLSSHDNGMRDEGKLSDAVAVEESSLVISGMGIPVLGKSELPVRATDSGGFMSGLWHVLYDDGSVAALTHSELRSIIQHQSSLPLHLSFALHLSIFYFLR